MNSRFSLAVHILSLLATSPDDRLTSEFLAATIGTNPVVIRRLMGHLRRAGLVSSKRAGGGGWSLARPAAEISLDLVRQALVHEEKLRMHRNQPDPNCPVGRQIRNALFGIYESTDAAVNRELARITVAQVLERAMALEAASISVVKSNN